MGKCCVCIDEIGSAITCFNKHLQVIHQLCHSAIPSLIDIYTMLSYQSLRMQRYERAKTYLNHLLVNKQHPSNDVKTNFELLSIYGYLGFCCIKANCPSEAKEYLMKALRIQSKT